MSSRREREFDQLRDLCRSGTVGRAIDLAFEHFAEFGRDDAIVALLAEAIDGRSVPERVRHRLAELRASRL